MRTLEQISKLQETHSETVQFQDVISSAQIEELKSYYYSSKDILQKTTGPKVLYVEDHPFIKYITEYLQQYYRPFEVRSAHFFEVTRPHVVHIDDEFGYPDSYKAFTIPIETIGAPSDRAKLVMFNQYYYGGPAKFFQGESEDFMNVHYNKTITDYQDICYRVKQEFPEHLHIMLLNHLKKQWLDGLSIDNYFPWKIGSIIAFDSLRLHSASDFTRTGITKKLGLSIFTKLK